MTFTSAQTVGKYEFLGIIDKPKAGVTYKVRNLATGEFEVLRALPGSSHADHDAQERFLREIRVHTRLSHPNVVAFHDAQVLDGQLVMTSEFVEGQTLAERCRATPLPLPEAIHAISQVLSGLEEAHALGIVHRGITAEHVTITPAGEVKLGGFGLAKPAADVNLTQTGAILGDPAYISPEQITGATPLDARSDLYSVGVLLYLAITGKAPFRSATDFDVMAAHVGSVPPPPSSLNPAISLELDRIVLTALAKRPEQRFRGAAEFRAALETVANQLAAQAPVPSRRVTQPQGLPRSKRALGLGLAAIAIALIVIVFVAAH